MLWLRALRCSPVQAPAQDRGTGANDSQLTYILVTALCDLLALRGDDALATAALRIVLDPRLATWFGAMAADPRPSQPLRVTTAVNRLVLCTFFCPCSSLGVSMCPAFFPPALPKSNLAIVPFIRNISRDAAAPPQAIGQDRVHNRAGLSKGVTAAGRVQSQLSQWTAEALESMCCSVRGDELDARCTAIPLTGGVDDNVAHAVCFCVQVKARQTLAYGCDTGTRLAQ